MHRLTRTPFDNKIGAQTAGGVRFLDDDRGRGQWTQTTRPVEVAPDRLSAVVDVFNLRQNDRTVRIRVADANRRCKIDGAILVLKMDVRIDRNVERLTTR